jgi:DNA-binding MarR family transcriptional regulator
MAVPSSISRVRSLPLYESPERLRLETWLQLVRTFDAVERRIVAALARHDITLPQFDVLATLLYGEGVTQQELARRLLVTKGNVCGLLDRLEKLGWVERRPDAKDARANRLHLTAAGRRKAQKVLPAHDQLVLDVFRPLPDSAVKALRQAMAVIEQAGGEE